MQHHNGLWEYLCTWRNYGDAETASFKNPKNLQILVECNKMNLNNFFDEMF